MFPLAGAKILMLKRQSDRFCYDVFMSYEDSEKSPGDNSPAGVELSKELSKMLESKKPLEGLEQFPEFETATRHYEAELDDYLHQMRSEMDEEIPDGYVPQVSCEEVVAANPHIAIALFLKRRGAPISLTSTTYSFEDPEPGDVPDISAGVNVSVAPEVADAYQHLWREMFHKPPRQFANGVARGTVSASDAFPSRFHVVPLVNQDTLWAHQQGILERGIVTAALVQYLSYGADKDNHRSVNSIAPLVEQLLKEQEVKPLALETILGMAEATVAATLAEEPGLAEQLQLDPDSTPEVDASKLKIPEGSWDNAFDAYWKPVFDRTKQTEGQQ